VNIEVKVVEMLEEIRPNLPKIFEHWYQMQFIEGDALKRNLEIAHRIGNEEPLNL
jgi:hypothetical protein